jgi:predicted nucleic acid-binding protein
MRYNRIFLDTAFVQALLNKKDEFHEKAKSLTHHLREAKEVWIVFP